VAVISKFLLKWQRLDFCNAVRSTYLSDLRNILTMPMFTRNVATK